MVSCIKISLFGWFHDKLENYTFNIIVELSVLAVFSFSFCTLIYLLFRYHRFEFRDNVTHIVCYFVLLLFMYAFAIYLVYSTRNFTETHTKSYQCQLLDDNWYGPIQVVIIILGMMGTDLLVLSYCVIQFKKNEDLLQGISKLDYYLKVSMFQLYKAKDAQSLIVTTNHTDMTVSYRNY